MVIAWERPHPPGQLYTAAVMWPCVRVCGHGPSLLVEKRKNKITRAPFFLFSFLTILCFPFPPLSSLRLYLPVRAARSAHTRTASPLIVLFVCLFSSGEWRFFLLVFLFTLQIFACQLSTHLKNRPSNSGGPHLSHLVRFFPVVFSVFFCFCFLFEYTNGFEKCWCLLCGTESDFQWASHLLLWHFSFIPWPFFPLKMGNNCHAVSACWRTCHHQFLFGVSFRRKQKEQFDEETKGKHSAAPAAGRA